MGIYIFSGSVLAWLPPLLFSLLNEIGASMTIGLASLNLFFAGGFVLLLMVGNYDKAVALAQNEDGVRMTSQGFLDDAVVINIPVFT
jgi:MFS-type transporter involved in bile tolerance (Atg22 family)